MLKQIMLLTAVSGLIFACGGKKEGEEKNIYISTSFREPADSGLRFIYSRDGYHWEDMGAVFLHPEVGTQKVMRDPSIVQGPDGTFHLVWTSSWRNDLGFGYSSSKDLVNWTPQQHIVVMDWDTTTRNVWAPELFYDDEDGFFYIAWSSSIPSKFGGSHRQYYTRTKDFKTFEPAKLFYDPGYNSIDGAVLKRGKGDYVLAVKDNRKPGYSDIHVAFGPTPAGPWSNESEPFTPEYSEGPTWAKVGDKYLIYFDVYRQYRYGAVSTTDFKTFTDISDQISVPKNHKHGTIFMVSEKTLEGVKAAAEKIRAAQASVPADSTANK